jgi:hypothetical protein
MYAVKDLKKSSQELPAAAECVLVMSCKIEALVVFKQRGIFIVPRSSCDKKIFVSLA